MPTLEIAGRRVQVADQFMQMSPDEQNAAVTEIAQSLGLEPAASDAPTQMAPRGPAAQEFADFASKATQNPARGQYEALPGWQKPIVAASDIMQRTANGALFNMGDELAAGLRAPFTDKSFAEELAEQERMSRGAANRSGGAGTVAELAGGLQSAVTMGRRGLSLADRAVQGGHGLGRVALGSAADGLIMGGVNGAGESGTMEERLASAASGAKAGLGAGLVAPLAVAGLSKAAQKAVSPFLTNSSRADMADVMRREGVDLTAGQKTGSKGLRYAESEIGGNRAAELMDRQAEQYTAAALRRAGIDANRATPEVIDEGFRRIGQQFDGLAARNTLIPDKKLIVDLQKTFREYGETVPESARAPIVEDLTNDIVTAVRNHNRISGESYQALRSRLERIARNTRSDPQLSDALRGLKDALDNAMERSIFRTNPRDLKGWKAVRRQYRNMLIVERAATGAGENAALGLISPSQLRNATVQQSRRSYARGHGDFAELSRAGEALMKPLPNSGTAGRTAARNLGAMAPSIVGAGAGGAYGAQDGGGLQGALVGALTGFVAPRAVGRLMMSKGGQRYLANQLMRSGPMTRARQELIRAVLTYGGASVPIAATP